MQTRPKFKKLAIDSARDWTTFPAIVEIDSLVDVYALGDVHGDYDRLVDLLVAGGLLGATPSQPDQAKWAGGKAILICTGDLIDKWKQSLKVIALFKALQADAARGGGRVIVTMGNHEAEFLADPSNDDKAFEFLQELDNEGIVPLDVAAGRDRLGIGQFFQSLPFAARINDWFFAHAGNTHGQTLSQLASALRNGVDASGYSAPILLDEDSLLGARLRPAPWWETDEDTPEQSQARLASYVMALGARHLVIGHQPGLITFADSSKR